MDNGREDTGSSAESERPSEERPRQRSARPRGCAVPTIGRKVAGQFSVHQRALNPSPGGRASGAVAVVRPNSVGGEPWWSVLAPRARGGGKQEALTPTKPAAVQRNAPLWPGSYKAGLAWLDEGEQRSARSRGSKTQSCTPETRKLPARFQQSSGWIESVPHAASLRVSLAFIQPSSRSDKTKHRRRHAAPPITLTVNAISPLSSGLLAG